MWRTSTEIPEALFFLALLLKHKVNTSRFRGLWVREGKTSLTRKCSAQPAARCSLSRCSIKGEVFAIKMRFSPAAAVFLVFEVNIWGHLLLWQSHKEVEPHKREGGVTWHCSGVPSSMIWERALFYYLSSVLKAKKFKRWLNLSDWILATLMSAQLYFCKLQKVLLLISFS